jgi:hypothetical protein
MDAGLFFVFSSPEVMAKADAVIENLLKVWMQIPEFHGSVEKTNILLRRNSVHTLMACVVIHA